MSDFFQDPPRLENAFTSHRWLRSYLRFKLPEELHAGIEADLTRLGQLSIGPYLELARRAEREKPTLVAFDAWGRRKDEIRVSSAWEAQHRIAAEEGFVAIGYRRAEGAFSRLYQFAKLYLYHPSSAFFTCPLAMADGAAKVLETFGRDDVHRHAFNHLTTRDPAEFWTSGQWMTERTGGSDVADTSTEVVYEGEQARLFGTKWFASATTSQIALALARAPGAGEGSRGLTLYLVPLRLGDGHLNHLNILRLKDKLGTWALPTAEIRLEGALAHRIGERDQGVKTVAGMLNITRLYNSVCSVAQMTRALAQLKDYSRKRVVFGAPLDRQVLHAMTFAHEELKTMAGTLLTFELAHLLGREECGEGNALETGVLRLLTPICKLFTARAAVQTASEVIEGFGGAGYVEDTEVPVHLRDAQVFPIWEGATNVLSLDVLRVLSKTNSLLSLKEEASRKLKSVRHPELMSFRDQVVTRFQALDLRLSAWHKASPEDQAASGRDLSVHLAWLYATVLAIEWADHAPPNARAQLGAWISQMLKVAGEWRPRESDEVARAHRIWQTKLGED